MSGTPNTALDEVWITLLTPASMLASRSSRVPSTLTVRRRFEITREWHLRHVVHHDVDTLDRLAHRRTIADVAGHELHVGGPIGCVVEVEHPDPMPGGSQAIDEQGTEVATPAGDENEAHSSMPWSRHHRMLRRMPSYSSTSGS